MVSMAFFAASLVSFDHRALRFSSRKRITSVCWKQVDVVHPMACGAKDGEVGKAVVGAVAIEMSDLKDLPNTETAMNADRGIRVKGELAVVEKASAHRSSARSTCRLTRYGWNFSLIFY